MKRISLIAVAMLLSACGGGSRDDTPSFPLPTPTPRPDAFYMRINALIGAAPEETEPLEIEMITATAPEDTEPVGG